MYPLRYHFFGLGIDYKLGLHEEIFNLCYHGQGGFTWDDVYNLPIFLRRFYLKQIIKFNEKQTEKVQQSNTNSNSIQKPVFRQK